MRRTTTRLANREVPPPPVGGPLAIAERVHHVLVADPRHDVIAELSFHLARAGYRVSTALTGPEALTALRLQPPTLLLVSDALPTIDGTEIVRRLRSAADGRDVAAVMLLDGVASAHVRADARVAALTLGADDCIEWPGDVRELVLRVAAITRRYLRVRPQVDETVRSGALVVDVGRAEVTVDGHPVRFTRTEFDLLWVLVKHPGRLFTRDQLLALTRGADVPNAPRRVDRHVTLLRAKLGALGGRIETITGKGYRFVPAPERDASVDRDSFVASPS